MFKKISALSAVGFALFAMSGCSGDGSSEPSSSSPGKNSCKVTQPSDNTVVMTMSIAGAVTTTSKTTLDGDKANIDVTINFSSTIPASDIKETCAENKAEAAERDDGSIVTCNDRTITIKTTEDAEIGIDKVYKSALRTCEDFYEEYPEGEINFDDDDDDDSDENVPSATISDPVEIDPIVDNGRATCKILDESNTEFEMLANAPDSLMVRLRIDKLEGEDGPIIKQTTELTFAPGISPETIDEFYEDFMSDAYFVDNFDLSRDENTIVETFTFDDYNNLYEEVVTEMESNCNSIQNRGTLNFGYDDEDE